MTPLMRARLFVGGFFSLGAAALVYGGIGVLEGHIAIPVKNAAAVVLAVSDPDNTLFIWYTRVCIAAGFILIVCSAVAAFQLTFGGPSRHQRVMQAVNGAVVPKSVSLNWRHVAAVVVLAGVALLLWRLDT